MANPPAFLLDTGGFLGYNGEKGQCHQLKALASNYAVIANQSADWCGNPFPVQTLQIHTCYPKRTDCHVAALLAMTVVVGMRMLKLMTLP